ncbi:ZIP family metal transporter [Kribbella sp. CA-293567]|uniref:ZIP family metal transporter n=1 Tax=Kribbella sp. CA-293567 TaxID=3002436 RepID=UPI0022DD9E81|nr:ZIP family metal transporter [Kribbella sp. CA-293567]WBQ02086.1 ZIP family metal transporter [Kribbella sp. CA-293567]
MSTAGLRGRMPVTAVAIVVVVLVALGLAALALLGNRSLPERTGPPVEELAVERVTLSPGIIELTLRNTGPDPVQVAQIAVNDAYAGFTGAEQPLGRLGKEIVRIDYPWAEGQPYTLAMLTSTGAVIEHEIPAAVESPKAGKNLLGLMALLGTYVGVIPVVLGMIFLPVLRRVRLRVIRGLMALTVGLLAFLAIDAAIEGLELAAVSGGAFGGPLLVILGAGLAFLALTAVDRYLKSRESRHPLAEPDGGRLALMIAIGIGLHNLGEGLAIGSAYAVGELALGAALVVGFALHNTTEGLAIVAPLASRSPSLVRLLGLGLLAGGPAIAGAAIGASVNDAALASALFGVGVGAIAQVIVQLAPSLRSATGKLLDPTVAGGVAAGLLVMYATGLLVAA